MEVYNLRMAADGHHAWLLNVSEASYTDAQGICSLLTRFLFTLVSLQGMNSVRFKDKADWLQPLQFVELSARIPARESFPASLVEADGAVFL